MLCRSPHFCHEQTCRAGARTRVCPCVRSLILSTLSFCSRTARCAGTWRGMDAPTRQRSFGPEHRSWDARGRGWQLQPFDEVKRRVPWMCKAEGPKLLLTGERTQPDVSLPKIILRMSFAFSEAQSASPRMRATSWPSGFRMTVMGRPRTPISRARPDFGSR